MSPVSPVPTISLANGVAMPTIGLGTARLKGMQAEAVVSQAIHAGYRLIDTAETYENERNIGNAIRTSGIRREEIFLTTKFDGKFHGFEEAQQAFDLSAERLGTDYIDLLLIHWPLPALGRYVDAWRGMIRLLETGKVRAIGVSNFKPAHLERLQTETGVTPHVNQIQLNPNIARLSERTFHADNGIQTEAWSPLDRGKETILWRQMGRKLRRRLRGWGGNLLEEAVIQSAAKLHGKTPAQVVLRWHVQLGVVPIPKTSNPQRLRENLDIFDFELSPEEMESIAALDGRTERDKDSDIYGH
jgi:2,5-diketo-D-gluconate reductase A